MEERKSKFKDGHSFLICGWMTNRLGLYGLNREVYAIIFQYSQGVVIMRGSCKEYIADATGSSLLTINRILKELISKDYIKEIKDEEGNIGYMTNEDILD